MPRPKNLTPSYLLHKPSGRARFVWTDPTGHHHDRLLPGPHGSAESRAAFARMMLEWEASPGSLARPIPAASGPPPLSVAEVLVRYLAHAGMYYKDRDGKPASAMVEAKLVVRAIRELYGTLPVTEFGPLKLKAVQQGWVKSGLSRASCNKRLGIAKRLFKWAASEELVPPSVFQSLSTVGGLHRGHTAAHDPDPIGPVGDAIVDATLPHLVRHVQGLIQTQRWTGMRPGEVTRLRMCDIDTTGTVWVFRPKRHKNEHRGHTRAVAIGKRAQEIIAQFRTADDNDYLFSPHRAMLEMQAARSANRRTKKYPSEKRKLAKQKKGHRYNDHYTTVRYGIAIARACDRAFPAPAPLGQRAGETMKAWRERLTPKQREELKAWQDAHRWAPNRLRHTFGTMVRKAHGLEAAQVTLGHARADVTQIYAEKNEALAVAIAEKLG